MGAERDRAALVVNRVAGGRGRSRQPLQRRHVQRRANERRRRLADQQDGRGHRPQRHPRLGDDGAVKAQVHRAANHRDVHLGARDKAQIGIAAASPPRRQVHRAHDLGPGQRGAPRCRRNVLYRDPARAIRADHRYRRPRSNHRRHAVGGGRAVAQVAGQGGAPLDLGRADQIHRLDHAGPVAGQLRVLAHLGTGDGNADPPASVTGAGNVTDPRYVLDVDQCIRGHETAAQLDQNIRSACQEPGDALCLGRDDDSVAKADRGMVVHV